MCSPELIAGLGFFFVCLFSARKVFAFKRIAFSNPGEKQQAGEEDNPRLRGAFITVEDRLSPEGPERTTCKPRKRAGHPPLSPRSQENGRGFARPISPTYTQRGLGPDLDGWDGEGVSGRSSGVLSPFTHFCVLFKRDSNFAPAGLQSKATPQKAKAVRESSGCG